MAIQHNKLVRHVRAGIVLLRLLANDKMADQAVLNAIQRDLDQGNITYMDGLTAIESAVTETLPATILKTHNNARMYLDADSYSLCE